ncbi:unnamed protein product [Cylindrotheca closterium]|uniref:DUF6824 domain-containing protein n=1 Tax=Cylindrotheca closterium TaxID=2856 RepID=A0AAD2FR44_9STRA|nr:unnamed protein product [Cylindrotheca closterium]
MTASKKLNPKTPDQIALADKMRDAVAKRYTPWKDRKHKPKRRHKSFDEAIRDSQRISNVRKDDVIFGRGRAYQNHPGNRRMRAIVRKYKARYDSIHRSRKREIVEAAYSEITQDGARFLHKSREEITFAVVDMHVSLQKVRNTLGAKVSMVGDEEDASSLPLTETTSFEATAKAKSVVDSANSDKQQKQGLPQSLLTALFPSVQPQQQGLPQSLPSAALLPCQQSHVPLLPLSHGNVLPSLHGPEMVASSSARTPHPMMNSNESIATRIAGLMERRRHFETLGMAGAAGGLMMNHHSPLSLGPRIAGPLGCLGAGYPTPSSSSSSSSSTSSSVLPASLASAPSSSLQEMLLYEQQYLSARRALMM